MQQPCFKTGSSEGCGRVRYSTLYNANAIVIFSGITTEPLGKLH